MGKIRSVLICFLLLLILLLPVGSLLSACFGYRFTLVSVPAFAIAIAILSVIALLLDIFLRNTTERRFVSILRCILAPLSIVNGLIYIITCAKIGVVVCVVVSVGCCYFLAAKRGKPLVFKIATLAFPVLILLPMGFISLLALTFGNIGQNTVVQTAASPSGKYYAQVIDSDQGALGGDTLVVVCEKAKFDSILFKVEKKPRKVYVGEWGEFRNMRIRWKDDNCLIINSVKYEIE